MVAETGSSNVDSPVYLVSILTPPHPVLVSVDRAPLPILPAKGFAAGGGSDGPAAGCEEEPDAWG